MQKSFEINSKEDFSLSEIEFKNNNMGEFILEIRCKTSKASTELKGKMLAFQRLYNMDSASKQDFTLAHDISQNLVRITGNIANAFHIMNERGLISEELNRQVCNEKSVLDFFQESKKFSCSNEEEVFDSSIKEENNFFILTTSK